MRPKPKMFHRLPRILRPPHQKRPAPRRRPQRQLIQRQTLPPGLLDPRARRGGEPQRRDGDLGHGEQARVIGDGADNDDGFVAGDVGGRVGVGFGGGVGGVAGEAGEGERRAIDAGGEEAAEDDAVEGGVGTTLGRLVRFMVCLEVALFGGGGRLEGVG